MKKKVGIIGHFGFGKEFLDGQTVKTKTLAKELKNIFGDEQIILCDTHNSLKFLVTLLFTGIRLLQLCDNIIILPAHNGIRIIAPLLCCLNFFFKKKLHYVVIGGWLPKLLLHNKTLSYCLSRFAGIYVETKSLQDKMYALGFNNVYIMPNSKELTTVSLSQSNNNNIQTLPMKLCIFSRIMKQKGIEDAVNVIIGINKDADKTIYTLDIYGQIDRQEHEWFHKLKDNFPPYISYNGCVPYEESTNILKNYFALLFPTRFYTEGVPGTIIDAYASALPVIASRWENFHDVIDDGKTGYGYEFENIEDFHRIMNEIVSYPEKITDLKHQCLEKAHEFSPHTTIKVLLTHL